MSTKNTKEALKIILKKAASDATFRAKALKDPAAALKEAGVELPAGQTIKFVEKIDEVVIALPPIGSNLDEISDEQFLQNVAGGGGAQWSMVVTCTPRGNEAISVGTPVPTATPMPPTSIAPPRTTVSWIL